MAVGYNVNVSAYLVAILIYMTITRTTISLMNPNPKHTNVTKQLLATSYSLQLW